MQIHTDKLPTLIEFARRGLLRQKQREHPEHARSRQTRVAEAPLLHDIRETLDPVDTELDRRQLAEQLLAQAKDQASISWAPAPFASQRLVGHQLGHP